MVTKANIEHKIVKEMMELSETLSFQAAINQACKFYLTCLKYRQEGNLILATPWKVTKNGDFVVDEKKVGQAIVIKED